MRNRENLAIYAVKIVVVIFIFSAMVYVSYGWHGFDTDHYEIPSSLLPASVIPIDQGTYFFFPDVVRFSECWMGVQVLPGEMDATNWINKNTVQTDKFVDDIPGAELVMGMTTRVSTVGGDWANAPHAVSDMYSNSEIYRGTDPQKAHDLARQMNATYLIAPNRNVWAGAYDGPVNGEKFTDPTYFQQVYKNDDVTIYRVLP